MGHGSIGMKETSMCPRQHFWATKHDIVVKEEEREGRNVVFSLCSFCVCCLGCVVRIAFWEEEGGRRRTGGRRSQKSQQTSSLPISALPYHSGLSCFLCLPLWAVCGMWHGCLSQTLVLPCLWFMGQALGVLLPRTWLCVNSTAPCVLSPPP